jgi:hypothetical protein
MNFVKRINNTCTVGFHGFIMSELLALGVSFRPFPENPQGNNLHTWEGKGREGKKTNYMCVLQRCNSVAQDLVRINYKTHTHFTTFYL